MSMNKHKRPKLGSLRISSMRTARKPEKHEFLVDHSLHPEGWEGEIMLSNGASIGASAPMILDSGADFVLIPKILADRFIEAGGTLYPPAQPMIDQASTSAEVIGMIYATFVMHSPTGGKITFTRMQCGVLESDTILVSNWIMDRLNIETYLVAEQMAKNHVVLPGNAMKFSPKEKMLRSSLNSIRIDEPVFARSYDECMTHIPETCGIIKARYAKAAERIALQDRLSDLQSKPSGSK